MNTARRRIGSIGTASRVIVALGLLYLALTHGPPSWGLTWYDAVLGLIAFPAVMVAAGLAARRFAGRAVHFTGPLGLAINCAVIVALLANRHTAGGAELFYGVTLLVAAWRGQPGCEATVLSNLILGRDDQIGCPAFTPIDALEARRRGRAAEHTQPGQTWTARPTTPRRHHMTAGQQPAPGPRDGRHDTPWRNPLLHLIACLAIGALVMLVILALHLLA
jgi:hypothetical protein